VLVPMSIEATLSTLVILIFTVYKIQKKNRCASFLIFMILSSFFDKGNKVHTVFHQENGFIRSNSKIHSFLIKNTVHPPYASEIIPSSLV
jgi:hypothetical protein